MADPRDDYAMGSLAADDAWRGEYPNWPPSPIPPERGLLDRIGDFLGPSRAEAAPRLPMDTASRAARAVEQGFTRDAFRGEGAPISGSSFREHHPGRYDPGFLGGDAIYSTNAPRIANDYSTFKAYREADPAPNVMPLKVKMDNPHVISGEDKTRIAQMDRFERDDWLRGIYAKGHDGVLVKYPGGYEEYVAPAKQYRSRFAEFDPAHAGGSDLLKGVAGGGVVLGGLAAMPDDASAATPSPRPADVRPVPPSKLSWAGGVQAARDIRDAPYPTLGPAPTWGDNIGEITGRMGELAAPVAEGFALPKRLAEGVRPERPGSWSEEDEFRRQHLAEQPYEWGPQTAAAEVFWPRYGARGTVGSGALIPEKGIRAYHSSPHDFERFDASRIGTGEGAQSYGHGLYFAENPAVSGQGGEYWNAFTRNFKGPEWEAANVLKQHNFDRDAAVANAEKLAAHYQDKHTAEMLDLLKSGKPVGPRTYEVNINARPEQMLDWNKPIMEQPQRIVDTIADLAAARRVPIGNSATGERIYSDLINQTGMTPERARKANIERSAMLRDAGIPGIRYLDQGSRFHPSMLPSNPIADTARGILEEAGGDSAKAITLFRNSNLANSFGSVERAEIQKVLASAAQKPTYNTVVFPGNEHLIDILKKYGIAGAAPAGLGALAARDQYAQ